MKKRLLALLLTVVMTACVCPMNLFADVENVLDDAYPVTGTIDVEVVAESEDVEAGEPEKLDPDASETENLPAEEAEEPDSSVVAAVETPADETAGIRVVTACPEGLIEDFLNDQHMEEWIKRNLGVNGIIVDRILIGSPFLLNSFSGGYTYYFPIMDEDKNIVSAVNAVYYEDDDSWSYGVGPFFERNMNDLQSTQPYVIYLDEQWNVYAVSADDFVVLFSPPGLTAEQTATRRNSNATMDRVVSSLLSEALTDSVEANVVDIQESIIEFDAAGIAPAAAGNGKWLYNYPAMLQFGPYCWAVCMSIILYGLENSFIPSDCVKTQFSRKYFEKNGVKQLFFSKYFLHRCIFTQSDGRRYHCQSRR